jgi:hypothetical protein
MTMSELGERIVLILIVFGSLFILCLVGFAVAGLIDYNSYYEIEHQGKIVNLDSYVSYPSVKYEVLLDDKRQIDVSEEQFNKLRVGMKIKYVDKVGKKTGVLLQTTIGEGN